MAIHYIESLQDNLDSAKKLISYLSNPDTKIIYIDTETSGLDYFVDKILLVQIAVNDDIFVIHRGNTGQKFLQNIVKRINESDLLCVGHNVKFDAKMIRTDTGMWLNRLYDTMIMESVLRAGVGEKLYSLATLVAKYCGVYLEKDTRSDFIGKSQSDSFTQNQITYSATDVLYLKDIYEQQIEDATKNKLTYIVNLETDVTSVVCDMEYTGINLDKEHWAELTRKAEERLRQFELETKTLIIESIDFSKYANGLEFAKAVSIPVNTKRDRTALESVTDPSTCKQWVMDNFNVGSHKQLLAALTLGGVKTKSTNEKILNKLPKNKIVDSLLNFREFQKQVSTYGWNIIKLVHPVTGKIHTEYYQMGTATGRFSSTEPNMQNLPRKGGYREGFVASEGYTFVSIDYSQQEYRLAGALSKEPKIIQAYLDGWDMHTATAANRFEKELKDVTSEERTFGKTMNFAVLYGTTEWGIKKNFSISTEEATSLLDKFFSGYPVLTAFKNAVESAIVRLGYSVTPMGRRRYFKPLPTFGSPQELEKIVAKMKREGFNHVIQGGGADVTKLAMVYMRKRNPFGDLFRPILQVHDEVVVEIHDSILDKGEDFMANCMLEAFQPLLGNLPAKVDSKRGKRWGK